MTVPTYIQPDNTTQSASVYKAAIDAATAVNAQIGAAFAAHEAATPNMTVVVDAGIIGGLEVAEQTSSTITAPTTNPRNDIATINLETGDLSIITGAEAATPVDPDIPLGEIAICRIELDNSPETTSITNTIIDNLRGYIITKENLGIYMSGWDISSSNYLEKQFSVSTQIVAPEGIVLSNDGTKMYAVDSVGEVMYQYTLDPAWDLSTAVYASKSLDVTSEDATPVDMTFNDDGTKLYIIGHTTDTVYQYTLTTAWDLSTASYASKSYGYATQNDSMTGIALSSDGTKLYLLGIQATGEVYQYTLSTAWDISTASYASKSIDISTEETSGSSLAFNSTGTRMFVLGTTSDAVHLYLLQTAWDLSTAVYAERSFSVAAQDVFMRGLAFSSDGKYFYTIGQTNDKAYQYSSHILQLT